MNYDTLTQQHRDMLAEKYPQAYTNIGWASGDDWIISVVEGVGMVESQMTPDGQIRHGKYVQLTGE